MRMCVRKVVPRSKRMSRCLPTASTASMLSPACGRRPPPVAWCSVSRTSGRPASAGRSRLAVRWSVSPSGTVRTLSALSTAPVDESSIALDEAGGPQLGGDRLHASVTDRHAVDLADLE